MVWRVMPAARQRVLRPIAGREPIAYRDLGVEQLGAVRDAARLRSLADPSPRLISLEPVRGAEGTGTFTPQSLAHYLVRRTLTPPPRRAPIGFLP